MMQIKQNQTINGIVVLDKPVGLSSNAALVKVRKLYQVKKAGHTGSLDPLASGMLPICLGEATKYSTFLLESDKCYQAEASLGIETDTGDAEGTILTTTTVPDLPSRVIDNVLNKFCGKINQVPPMYSALKHRGKPLYHYARKGETIERASREVHIKQLEYLSFERDKLLLDIKCSKGTYIRTLVEDIGKVLGCGAHVSMLRRYQVSDIDATHMVTLDLLQQMTDLERMKAIYSVENMLQHWPGVQLSNEQSKKITNGQNINISDVGAVEIVRVHDPQNRFLGMAKHDNGVLKPIRMMKNKPSSINV